MSKDDLFYLPVKIGNVELRNPFIRRFRPHGQAVGPTGAGREMRVGAAALKQTFNPLPYINYQPRYRWLKKEKLHVFTAEYRLNMEQGLRLAEEAVRNARRWSSSPTIPTSRGRISTDGWKRPASLNPRVPRSWS